MLWLISFVCANLLIVSAEVEVLASAGLRCGADSFLRENPPMMLSRASTPSRAQAPQQPSNAWMPIRIMYFITPSTSRANEHALRLAFDRVNQKLRPILKVQHPCDILVPHRVSSNNVDCIFPMEWGRAVKLPLEHHFPCILNLSDYVPEKGVHYKSEEVTLLDSQSVNVIIYVRADAGRSGKCDESDEGDTIAKSGSVLFDDLGFTYLGVINFCSQLDKSERLYSVLLHETIHVLMVSLLANHEYVVGVDPGDVRQYDRNKARAENQTWRKVNIFNGIESQVVSTPTVLQVAREYFKCNSPQFFGAELGKENINGVMITSNTHWDSRLFPDELMSLVRRHQPALSKLTLAAIKDSGWYEVDMTKADPMMFDATLRNIQGDACHVALKNCTQIFRDAIAAKKQFALPWVGAFCDPTGEIPTRACTSDGRYRQLCFGGDEGTLGCSVYIRHPALDRWGDDCSKQAVSPRLEAMIKSYKVNNMCASFAKYRQSVLEHEESSWLKNYPACYHMNCTPATKSMDLYVFLDHMIDGSLQQPCKIPQVCGVNKSAVYTWRIPGDCLPPYYGTLVCPDYEEVCEKPGGVGVPKTKSIPQEEVPSDKSTASVRNKALGIITMIMIANPKLKCIWLLEMD